MPVLGLFREGVLVDKIDVLNAGYVRLTDHMGTDLTVINSARTSFEKESKEFSSQDEGLLRYLVENKHFSPMRHCVIQFEVRAPIMVARQFFRYITGTENGEGHDEMFAWNEASRRYITSEPVFYVPESDAWRGKPTDGAKQGSHGHLSVNQGEILSERLFAHIDDCLQLYDAAMDWGVAPEQARLFLPANSQYITWYLTISLQGLAHLLAERLDGHAMAETRIYATAMKELALLLFPRTFAALAERIRDNNV